MVKGVNVCPDDGRKKDVAAPPTTAATAPEAMLLTTSATVPDGRQVTISRATEPQMADLYAMVQQAALRSEGFGADEFPTEAHFRAELQDGQVFFVSEQDSGKVLAALIITSSKFFRGQAVADPYIIVTADERRKGIGEFCFRTCVDYCQRLGFLGIYVDMFANNLAMRRIVENSPGFRRVGFLPMGGCLQDGTIVGSIVYHKDLRGRPAEGGADDPQLADGDLDPDADPPS